MNPILPKKAGLRSWHSNLPRQMRRSIAMPILATCITLLDCKAAMPASSLPPSTWPQAHSVQRNETSGLLTVSNRFYTVVHDLRQGGAITRITLHHGKASNLLVHPIETRLRDEQGVVLSDLKDATPKIGHHREGLRDIISVESTLLSPSGKESGVRVSSRFDYRWGYVRIHREFLLPKDRFPARELSPFSTVLTPSLSHYGYREGITEEEGAPPFAFGSNRWKTLHTGQASDQALQTRFIPRSMIFVDPGVEGLEWFVSSDLSQWDLQLTGRRGDGQCLFQPSQNPAGLALSLSPLWNTNRVQHLTNTCSFDFYLAVPLIEGHAHPPWLHTSFNRNRGNWVPTQQILSWAEKGIQTVHCHNDGDYYNDGLFWRDGSYPPYPDMDRYDQVLQECRRAGIHTATYFSNKELHPSTEQFQKFGALWGRKNLKGELRHNFFKPQSEFGAQMCLRSGWLEFLKFSIDRVLHNHPLSGVYYDWNVALFCCNPLHEGHRDPQARPQGHWDIDELLDLMEWTRTRVGPAGLVILHNTTTPMFATENFANHIVATEWGYGKWTDRAPALKDLPLEWSLAGARSRGVISYGTIDANAPRRLHRLFALQALLGGVTPWPASPETFDLLPRLQPIGNFQSFQFADWRNQAVGLSHSNCASALYSRPGESYLLLANLHSTPTTVNCQLHPAKLPHPLHSPLSVTQPGQEFSNATRTNHPAASTSQGQQLVTSGLPITIPGDDALLLHVQEQKDPWPAQSPPPIDYTIQLDTIRSGFDKRTCWVHARAGAIPGPTPTVVLTMQKLLLTGSDVFYPLNEMRTDDLGKTWSGPVEHHQSLERRKEPDGVIVAPCDFWPKWHAASGKLLGIGHTVRYRDNRVIPNRKRETCYSVYDPNTHQWTSWTTMEMPDPKRFYNAGAGSVQRLDLPNGHILLPIYFKERNAKFTRVTVLRCAFDGRRMSFLEQGNELSVNSARGLGEPSLTLFRDRYYLTLRHDKAGYVCSSSDGLHFDEVRPWLWEDGSALGNYNTQQHWVTHQDGLFLVYTRRGAHNDHVFRHRAPLFMAQVDPDRLRVIRSTERVLVPERGARLGNFGVTYVSPQETWVTVTEWMQTTGPNPHDYTIPMKYGSDNAVFVARIRWSTPNRANPGPQH